MFLSTLKIEARDSLVREINFTKGINLIVDETGTKSAQESGNNVGKTTVLRLIDYCLGGKGANIYSDTEFKDKSNSTIESYLKDQGVVITLCLKVDLSDKDSVEIIIRRNFLSHSRKLQEINGELYSNIKDFRKELQVLIFKSNRAKPTFRQMIAKNIRDEKNRLQHTVKILHSTTTKAEYEALYLFWLGIDIAADADEKQKLIVNQNTEDKLQDKLKKSSSTSQIAQSLLVISKQIEELEERKSALNCDPEYESKLAHLSEIKKDISFVSTKVARLRLRRDLIIESQSELEEEFSDADAEQLKSIYSEAKSLIPNIQKSFEETLEFHNSMVEEKMKFIIQELPDLNKDIKYNEGHINALLREEEVTAGLIRKSNTLDDLQEVVSKLNNAYEAKGALDEQDRLWRETLSESKVIESKLQTINKNIENLDGVIQERLATFNEYFSSISRELYGESFVLSTKPDGSFLELEISSLSGNLGTGKKKGQIASFDLAYVKFADSLGIDCLHFILSDQIENVHDNQISSLLNEVVNETNCQYILPVLRDKLPVDINVDDYMVLSLSQNSKLFKI